jgi:transposase
MKNKSRKVVFKNYNQNQMMLLPPSLDDMIEKNHPVRVVNQVLDNINADSLLAQYTGGGSSSYHPRMLLKVMVYSYLNNVYSSRKMEAALKENIHFMWLSGMSRPDHNTINRFRSERLKDVLKEIFSQVVMLLAESGHVSLQEIYVDGTKIESKANRYTFVWGKAIKTSRERIKDQLKELWDYAQSVAQEEIQDTSVVEFNDISAKKVQEVIDTIDKALEGKQVDKKVKQKINYAKKNWPENLAKYDKQEDALSGRNSYSKTDPDATFMRMKEDHMLNGQLKPAYNLQISTHNQFIVNYTHHQNPTDTTTLPSHLDQFNALYNHYPQVAVADAGYGSEENYTYAESKGIEAYIKYNYFDKDQHKKANKLTDNLFYNSNQDCFYCPMGQRMRRIGSRIRTTENGYQQEYSRYQAERCDGCSLKGSCNKSNGKWIYEYNHNLNRLKSKASILLNSPQGLVYRSKRGVDVEPAFANIKHNKGFKRFLLAGLSKTEIETGLLALAHNLGKLVA